MRWKDLRIIRKLEELLVQTAVEHCGQLLRSVLPGKIRPADVSHKQRISGKHGPWPRRLGQVGHGNTNTLDGMAGCRQKIETALTELERIAVFDRRMREGGARAVAEINARSGALRELMVAGDEVGVQVRLDDVLDLQTLLLGGFNVDVDVALRIDDRRDSFRTDQSRKRAPDTLKRSVPLERMP